MALTRPSRNPKKVQQKRRMAFLRLYAAAGRYDHKWDQLSRRQRFEWYKKVHLPSIKTQSCYVCSKDADHWHHIVHLCNGGDDCQRNLVPLCRVCHKRAHRHDPVRANRRQRAYKHVPVLIKPVLLMEVIPPKQV